MNFKVTTPCEKRHPNCYGDKPRVYATKEEAAARCQDLNEAKDQDPELVGTFSVIESGLPVG